MSIELLVLLIGLALHGVVTLGGVFAFFHNFSMKVENRLSVLETNLQMRMRRK